MLNDLYVEGLIHVTGLPKDYYYHEASQHRMVGERTGRIFRLGQKLIVKISKVNLEERKIDFELVDKDSNQGKSEGDTKKSHKLKVTVKAKELAEEYEKNKRGHGKSSKKRRAKSSKGKVASAKKKRRKL
jgi:ribonuclease R